MNYCIDGADDLDIEIITSTRIGIEGAGAEWAQLPLRLFETSFDIILWIRFLSQEVWRPTPFEYFVSTKKVVQRMYMKQQTH